jgi:hypothetical protein
MIMPLIHSEIPPPQHIDLQQAIAHLQALGYDESTPIYLRCFPSHKGSARNLQGTLAHFPESKLQQWQSQGYGVYFVVNGQGHKDADIHEGRHLFFEHDDLEKALQQNLWQTLGLPVPTIQVDTGGKSIHSYWRLEAACPITAWRELQADLLAFAQADRSIKNPSRVMRLAGFQHQSTGQMATLISHSGKVYTYEEMRAIVPRRGQSLLTVPLEVCLTRNDRALIQHGAPAGQRNLCGAKLARNLIGTERYLQQIRQPYEGRSRELFELYRSRCNPPISDQEVQQIWRSAESADPSPSLTPEAISHCISAWTANQTQNPTVKLRTIAQPANAVPIRPTPAETSKHMKTLLQQGLSGANLQAEKITLRAQSTISEREFQDLWQASDREFQQQETRNETKIDLDRLLEIGRYELGLKGILPDELAVPLERQAALLGSTPAAMLLTLLPAVASLAKVGTKLELIQATGFYALPILYTGIVCESGGAKSPTQKTILKPLLALQSDADLHYHQQLQDWETLALEDHKKPPKPLPREYVTQDVTREAIGLIQSQQPERGFIGWLDELSALIGSQNQYRNGRGTDREALLTGRDGTGIKVNRASGKRIVSAVSAYSITGGTQPDTLRHLMGDFSDGSGQWARFLWCAMPIKRAPYPEAQDDTLAEQITASLAQAYRRIERFTPITYQFTPDAQSLYRDWYEALDERRVLESRQSLRSVYAKAKGNTGELALLLHLTNAAIAGKQPTTQIPSTTLQSAIQVMKFCLGQVRLIHGLGDEMNGEISPLLAKIIELSDRKGWITARDTKNGIRGLKATPPDQIRDMFSELFSMGHGEIEGTGIRLKFRTKTADTVDISRQELSTDETPTPKRFQETVDTVDKISDVSQNTAFSSCLLTASTDLASTAPTTSTASLENAEYPIAQSLQSIDAVSTDGLLAATQDSPVGQASLNALHPLPIVSTVPTASLENAEFLSEQSLRPVDTLSTNGLQRSTDEPQADRRADSSEFEIGDRVTVKYISTWQPATLLAIPIPHANPSQRIIAWKARLDTGQEIYVWDIHDICPLTLSRRTP